MSTKPLNYEEKKQDVIINRVFDAAPEKLFQAWSDPKMIAQWWAAKTYTTPVVKIDFRVGGQFLYCMRSARRSGYLGKGYLQGNRKTQPDRCHRFLRRSTGQYRSRVILWDGGRLADGVIIDPYI